MKISEARRRGLPIVEIEGLGRFAQTEPLEVDFAHDRIEIRSPGRPPCSCCGRPAALGILRACSWEEAIRFGLYVEIEP